MSQKNEAPTLIASLLITLGLLGACLWWITQQTSSNLSKMLNPAAENAAPLVGSSSGSQTTGSATSQSNTTQSGETNFADVQDVPTGLFNYGGSTTWAPIRGQVDAEIQKIWRGFQLRYTSPITGTPGSSAGIRMLLTGQLSLAQSSRSLKLEEFQEAQQRGFTLAEIPVAIDSIAVAVHPSLEIPGLTVAQLQGIYAGEITNWQQVGGPDRRITPYSRRVEDGGTVEFFQENVLGEDRSFGRGVQFEANTTLAIRRLSSDPGGIYYASAPEIVPQCTVKPLPMAQQDADFVAPYQLPLIPEAQCPEQRNQLDIESVRSGHYPLTRRLFVVVKQDGQADQRAGEAYSKLLLTDEGQRLLSQTGFVPVR